MMIILQNNTFGEVTQHTIDTKNEKKNCAQENMTKSVCANIRLKKMDIN